MSNEDKPVQLRLRRSKDGEIQPVDGVSPMLAMEVKVLPMTYGDSRQYESFGDPLYSWSDEDKIAVINRHVIEPEIEIEDVDDLHASFDPWTIEDLVQAVFVYSGMARLFAKDDEEGNVVTGEEIRDQKPISA